MGAFLLLFGPAILFGILCRSFGLATLCMIIGTAYLCFSDDARRVETCEDKTVISVGGCNRYGTCRVGNSDGSDGYARFPLVDRVSVECNTVIGPVWWDKR